ncbi:cysteine desulfurase [Gammaproteobacteria bacterium]|nr:cysteine desulfurase [Gammaproteobacteria bacterium]
MDNGVDDLSVTHRGDFPILDQQVHGKPLVYLDSAASAQRPTAVIDAISDYYRHDHANVHRGVHTLSQRATERFDGAREKVRAFINAASVKEVIFTRGATEAFNLVANAWAKPRLGPGKRILVSEMEHHANLVPWQLVAGQTGAEVVKIPITDRGEIDIEAYTALLDDSVMVVALTHTSNALGTVNPLATLIPLAKAVGATVVIDGAQAAPHSPLDVQALGADFLAFAGHKMYGPTGVGVLWGREALLEEADPWQGGGDMIRTVSFSGSTWAPLPAKLEAGTPSISEVIGLGAAIDYLEAIGMERIAAHEARLLDYAVGKAKEVPGLRLIGEPAQRAGAMSFVLDRIHPHDIGTVLDNEGVAIRTGHHCAQPVMQRFGVPATARASFGLYNSRDDVDALFGAIEKLQDLFGTRS